MFRRNSLPTEKRTITLFSEDVGWFKSICLERDKTYAQMFKEMRSKYEVKGKT